ncbi:MAG: DUF3488 and transglutaminase-like domain-containing protein [Sulfuricella sp.]|nr:DUF3488 and transglutaminase-like domain-containing protein [Sulfuricella sp.]
MAKSRSRFAPGNPAPWLPAGLLGLALAVHAPALPLPAWLALTPALASRLLPASRLLSGARLVLLALAVGLAGLAFGWLDSATLRLALLLVLALKLAEARTRTEFNLIGAAAAVAVAIGLLQWGEGAGLTLVLPAAWLLAAGFACRDGARPAAGLAAMKDALREGGLRLLLALPLAGVLFVFFPRIPGPLWDIGLTFGLPLPVSIEKSNQGLGISTRLKPGQTQTGASDGQPVLVAEFHGWVPPTSQLYWRGPVFYDFDGDAWQMDAEYAGEGRKLMQRGWRSAAAFGEQLRSRAQEVRYRVRLTPHGGLWLYGLDLPSGLTSESFIGPDWQVLAHQPVAQEISYELSSWLEWTARAEIGADTRRRALTLPAERNPRLLALGRELGKEGSADAIARAALAVLAQGGYRVRDRFTPPQGKDMLDAFWFERKEGNAELYAGAFAVLMRAANVPARLVTGYRGGKLMALTDYVVVKRGHAHAWVEIWDEARGWRRIDPVDMIAPQRLADQGKPAKPAPAPTARRAPQEQPGEHAAPPPAGSLAAGAAPAAAARGGDFLPDVSAWLERWVFRLDGEKQLGLLDGKGGGFAWVWLLLAAALGSGLLLGARHALARWRERRLIPPPERHWRRACRLLAKHGLAPRAGECPSHYAQRVSAARPAWSPAIAQLCRHYAEWRYGRAPESRAADVENAARHLVNRVLAD